MKNESSCEYHLFNSPHSFTKWSIACIVMVRIHQTTYTRALLVLGDSVSYKTHGSSLTQASRRTRNEMRRGITQNCSWRHVPRDSSPLIKCRMRLCHGVRPTIWILLIPPNSALLSSRDLGLFNAYAIKLGVGKKVNDSEFLSNLFMHHRRVGKRRGDEN